MKDKIIIIAVPAMRCEVFHCFRTLLGIQSHMDVPHRGMQYLRKQISLLYIREKKETFSLSTETS